MPLTLPLLAQHAGEYPGMSAHKMTIAEEIILKSFLYRI